MWNLFKKKEDVPALFQADLHSHLLPNIDDGVTSFEEAAKIIRTFQEMGFKKAVTTPHIMSDTHRNSPETILPRLNELKEYLHEQQIDFQISAAAEYYFDELVMDMVNQNKPFLTFGDQFVLFETSTYTEPLMLNEFIFKLKNKGYQPVMAHPERYQYLRNNLGRVEDLMNRGALMQVNSLSLAGYYSKTIQKVAIELVENRLVNFLGSDCHTPHHAELYKQTIQSKHFIKALNLPLLNYTL